MVDGDREPAKHLALVEAVEQGDVNRRGKM